MVFKTFGIGEYCCIDETAKKCIFFFVYRRKFDIIIQIVHLEESCNQRILLDTELLMRFNLLYSVSENLFQKNNGINSLRMRQCQWRQRCCEGVSFRCFPSLTLSPPMQLPSPTAGLRDQG